jgi:hypothetical protein
MEASIVPRADTLRLLKTQFRIPLIVSQLYEMYGHKDGKILRIRTVIGGVRIVSKADFKEGSAAVSTLAIVSQVFDDAAERYRFEFYTVKMKNSVSFLWLHENLNKVIGKADIP